MRHLRYSLGVCSVAMGMFCLTLPLQAEMCVAGQMGVNIPRNLSNVELSGFGTTLGMSDLSLQNSLMYGAKAGYYFDSLKWQNFNLGVETEVFNSTPHIKQQEVTIGGRQGTLQGLTRTYLKIEKPHSIGHRSRETQRRDRDTSKDSAVGSWLWPINQGRPVLTNRF